MQTNYLKINIIQAAILICALDAYQAEGETIIHALDISDDPHSVDIFTGTIGTVEQARALQEKIHQLFGQ